MSESVFTTGEILEQFRETIWFPLVLGCKHTIKELKPLLALLLLEGKFGFRSNRRRFDKIIRDFEHAVVTYVTAQVSKDLNTISQMAAASNAGAAGDVQPVAAGGRGLDRDLGQAHWITDYFGDDHADDALSHLGARSRERCLFLHRFSNALALRKCN